MLRLHHPRIQRVQTLGLGLPPVGVDGPCRHLCARMRSSLISDRIGMYTSKRIFQLHGVKPAEVPVLRKKLRRREMVPYFEKLVPTEIAIEACSGSHYWARLVQNLVSGGSRALHSFLASTWRGIIRGRYGGNIGVANGRRLPKRLTGSQQLLIAVRIVVDHLKLRSMFANPHSQRRPRTSASSRL
jgi:hypothetical protein